MTTRRLARFALTVMLPFAALAPSSAEVNTVYDFLRTDVGARAGAMGGSFVSVTNDPTVMFYNAAALGTIDAPKGSVGFFKHLLDINSGYLSYTQPVEGIGSFGVGVVYINYGSFDNTDGQGIVHGTFGAGDFALLLGYSTLAEENLYYGVNAKIIYSSIAGYASSAIAGDVGLLYTIPENHIALGVSVRNIGTQMKSYLGTREELPLDVTVGGSIIPRGLPMLININFHNLNEDVASFSDRLRSFSVGGELTLSKYVQARIGYDNEKQQDLKIGNSSGLAGFSAGIGITTKGYRIDYALSSLGKIGSLHRISIGTDF